MKNMFKKLFIKMWDSAYSENKKNFLDLCEQNPEVKLVDLGCDDGELTLEVAKKIKTKKIYGLDLNLIKLNKAKKNGVEIKKGNLNEKLPFNNNSFDVVFSNQVIEHLSEVDIYISEIYRILKPGGYAVISTENLSSWHNIFSLIMGWQAFSQHVSKKYHIGNPLSPHIGEDLNDGWTHMIVFTLYSLREIFKKYHFKIEEAKGAGYYPLPNFFARIDPYHSHFITIKVRKKT